MSENNEHFVALRHGLVGDRHHLYLTNPEFHGWVDTLAHLLPFMINGLAEECERHDTAREALAKSMMEEAVPFVVRQERMTPSVCTDPDCTIPRKPGFPMHGPHDFRAKGE